MILKFVLLEYFDNELGCTRRWRRGDCPEIWHWRSKALKEQPYQIF
jgi:hypothetical protein